MTAVTITISRTSLPGSLPPLVQSGIVDDNEIGITSYQPPGRQARNTYGPDSADVDGSELLSTAWQQANLGYSYIADQAEDETDAQATYADVVAAIGQLSYMVTTQVGGAPAEVWAADRGSIQLANSSGRTFEDLENATPEYAVTIPVKPIPGSA